MSKVLVLYYSAFGYVAIVANAIADGARSAGAVVDVKRVPGSEPAGIVQGAAEKVSRQGESGAADAPPSGALAAASTA